MGQPVHLELSGAEYGYRAAAGFKGTLAQGVEDVIERVVGSDEAINFSVVASGANDLRGWFIVGRSTFETAVVARAPLGPALVIRGGAMDITITPDDRNAL
jgi:hypothetical protein